MTLERIDGLGLPPQPPAGRPAAGEGLTEGAPAFSDLLRDAMQEANRAMQEANRLQRSADQAIQHLARHDDGKVAEVMTAVEKADLAFRTLMQVRNKLLEAYEELMRLRI